MATEIKVRWRRSRMMQNQINKFVRFLFACKSICRLKKLRTGLNSIYTACPKSPRFPGYLLKDFIYAPPTRGHIGAYLKHYLRKKKLIKKLRTKWVFLGTMQNFNTPRIVVQEISRGSDFRYALYIFWRIMNLLLKLSRSFYLPFSR